MRVLIVGAGPAGLTLAYWLQKGGHTPVVMEKSPNIRTAGYMIDFAGSGWDVANRMGIIPQLEAVDHAVQEVVFKDSNGRTTAVMPTAKLYKTWGFDKRFLGLDRRDLVETLYHKVESDVEIHFDTTLTAIHQSAEEVTATFADGNEGSFDLLVGADGIHSSVRTLVFGSEVEFADYLGYYVACFYSPALIPDLPSSFLMHVEPGMQVGVMPLSGQRWLSILIYKSEDKGHIPPGERLQILKERARGVGWITTDLLNSLPADTPIYMDTVTQIEMPSWSSNRVALIGDAAYCMTLISGQGTSMAMAGAYFLAEELRQSADPHVALQCYEERLRPYIQQKQKKARNFAPSFVPSSKLRIALTQWAIRLIDLPPVTRLVGKQMNFKSIIPA
jgi:2-polyprenyl-6-methoxyphenol hydroxylase-like FAD-dependent oxidoreductase